MESYTSITGRGGGRFAEFIQLARRVRRSARRINLEVQEILDEVRSAEAFVTEVTSLSVKGLDVLEIGPGQLPRQIAYFARSNAVTAVDLDVIPIGMSPLIYWKIFRLNGLKRLLKTLTR